MAESAAVTRAATCTAGAACVPLQSWVAPRLTEGLGNRLFQLAAAWAFARATGRTCVLHASAAADNEHGDDALACLRFLPHALATTAEHGVDVESPQEPHLPMSAHVAHVRGGVLLRGFFQSWRIADAAEKLPLRVPPDLAAAVARALPHVDWRATAFVHVRRGDYRADALMCPLGAPYYRAAVAHVLAGGRASALLLCCNEDMDAAALRAWAAVPAHVAVVVAPRDWPGELVLAAMASCRGGGVVANSSLSWWAARLARDAAAAEDEDAPRFTMPSVWLRTARLARRGSHASIVPPWATEVRATRAPQLAPPATRKRGRGGGGD